MTLNIILIDCESHSQSESESHSEWESDSDSETHSESHNDTVSHSKNDYQYLEWLSVSLTEKRIILLLITIRLRLILNHCDWVNDLIFKFISLSLWLIII